MGVITDGVITTLKQYYDSILPVLSISFTRYLPYLPKTQNFLSLNPLHGWKGPQQPPSHPHPPPPSNLLPKVASSIEDLSRFLLAFEKNTQKWEDSIKELTFGTWEIGRWRKSRRAFLFYPVIIFSLNKDTWLEISFII